MKTFKRYIAMLMATVMLIGAMPTVAFAGTTREELEAVVEKVTAELVNGAVTIDGVIASFVEGITGQITNEITNFLTSDEIKAVVAPMLADVVANALSNAGINVPAGDIQGIIEEALGNDYVNQIISSDFVTEVIAKTAANATVAIKDQMQGDLSLADFLNEQLMKDAVDQIEKDAGTIWGKILYVKNGSWNEDAIKGYMGIALGANIITGGGISLPSFDVNDYQDIILKAAEDALIEVATEKFNELKKDITKKVNEWIAAEEARLIEEAKKLRDEILAGIRGGRLELRNAIIDLLNEAFDDVNVDADLQYSDDNDTLLNKLERASKIAVIENRLEIVRVLKIAKGVAESARWNDTAEFIERIIDFLLYKYNVTFDANDGVLFAGTADETDKKVFRIREDKELIKLPADPTREGYRFLGWQENGQDVTISVPYQPTGHVTFTAKWEPIPKYTVKFNSDGGTACPDVTDIYEDTEINLPHPTKNGFSFEGWMNDNKVKVDDPYKVVSDVTLTAIWTAIPVNPTQWRVNYLVNSGTSVTTPVNVTKGQSITLPTTTRAGYTFLGWYDGAATYQIGATYTPANNVTFSAQWRSNSTNNYDYYDDSNDNDNNYIGNYNSGTSTSTTTVTIDPDATPLAATDLQRIPSEYAMELYKLDLFVGTVPNANPPVFSLDKSLTRLEALILVIRLMGLENEASTTEEVNPFTDVPEWGAKYAAFGYAEGITVGVNEEHTLFDPDKAVSGQEFTAFLLRVLDYYEKNGDFEFSAAMQQATIAGLYNQVVRSMMNKDELTRGDAVVAMVEALHTKLNGSDTTLLETLVNVEFVTAEEAAAFLAAIEEIGRF